MKKQKETVPVKEPKEMQVINKSLAPADLIQSAVNKGADLDKLEKLLILRKEFEANEARKIFTKAFSMAQANIALVVKKKINPQTHSKYAPLEDIIESSQPIYTKEGFSIIFYENDTTLPEHIRICADVLHSEGHKETYHYDIPLDGVGLKGNPNMTKIHAKASSTSYARRYLMCMIWNIPTGDDDGNSAVLENIDESELSSIMDWITQKEVDVKKFCTAFGIESVEKLPKAKFQQAIAMLKAKVVVKK